MKQYKVDMKTFNFSSKEFRCYREPDGTIYTHRFPIIKHDGVTTIEGEFTIIGDTGEVLINVYDMNRNLYAPYYAVMFGDYTIVLNKINNNIEQELKRLGIKKNDKRAIRNTKKG